MAGGRKQTWNDLVRDVEEELAEQGLSGTDERKIRFLIAAYLRDIRDAVVKQSLHPVRSALARSAWDVPPSEEEDGGDTRPFAFIDELSGSRTDRPRVHEDRDDPVRKK
ncbi:MAG: hypothetical protein MUF54_14810 [Polyangiaceae bacterium]|nr:hypothetical protein [Polyangiaceae bacterium]